MVLVDETPDQTLSENSPLSIDDFSQAVAKNKDLNDYLGLGDEDEIDPSMDPEDEETLEETSTHGFSPLELEQIAIKNAIVNNDLECDNEEEHVTSEEHEVSGGGYVNENDPGTNEFFRSCKMELDSDEEVSIVIPNDIAAQIRQGGYNIVLEPVPGRGASDTVSYTIRSIPTDEVNIPAPPKQNTPVPAPDEQSDNCESEEDGGSSECENESSRAFKRGIGSAHKGGSLKKYDLWMRIGFTTAVRETGLTVKEACDKFKAPRRRARVWLQEYDRGDYSNLPSLYTQEELKKMYRLKGGGRKVKDIDLEEKLVKYYNELREDLYPITSELLAYECLYHDDKFLGGANSPHFTKRIADFLRHWRKRNNKRLRKPTSTGQKLPAGYTGKWEACSYYFYLETKGVPPENCWHGDETKIPKEEPPAKVYAEVGQKDVPCRTSGQEKDNLSAFLVQNTFGAKLPLYPIL